MKKIIKVVLCCTFACMMLAANTLSANAIYQNYTSSNSYSASEKRSDFSEQFEYDRVYKVNGTEIGRMKFGYEKIFLLHYDMVQSYGTKSRTRPMVKRVNVDDYYVEGGWTRAGTGSLVKKVHNSNSSYVLYKIVFETSYTPSNVTMQTTRTM